MLKKSEPRHNIMQRQHRILLEDMTINMSVGVLPHEKNKLQTVIVSVCIDLRKTKKPIRKLEQTICYDRLAKDIVICARKQHFDLIEEFADHIIDVCLQRENIKKISVKIKKPNALKEANVGIVVSCQCPKDTKKNNKSQKISKR